MAPGPPSRPFASKKIEKAVKKATCYYTDVSWEGGKYPEYRNIFKGWTYGQSRTKVYEVSEYYGQLKLIDKEDGYEYLLTAYK